jgi:F-type H+-transporting ATPase subunit epsilon
MELDSHLNLNLVSPDRLLFSSKVCMVTIPGEDGDMGVLPGHAPVLSTLRSGLISIFDNQDNLTEPKEHFFVDKGFARIDHTGCTILAEDIVSVSELNINDLEKSIESNQSKLEASSSDSEKAIFLNSIESDNRKLEVLRTLS